MAPGAERYCELNFAPSGQWAVYPFEAYRREGHPRLSMDLRRLSVRRFDDRLEVDAAMRLHHLTALAGAPRVSSP